MTGTSSPDTTRHAVSFPLNPFVSNRYHYGMLLGVADLEADQGYHRGKTWLHNAWLHSGGAIWGLRVERGSGANELIVRRGLALDHHGRELWLAVDECIDIGKWFATVDDDPLKAAQQSDTVVELVAHVRLCADQCLDRPVPSITEPCGDPDSETAYSRTVERARPELMIGEPAPTTDLYPRLRALLEGTANSGGTVQATDDTQAKSIGGCGPDFKPTEPQDGNDCDAPKQDPEPASCHDRWHRAAVDDTMALSPVDLHEPWSPFDGDGCITLARLEIKLTKGVDGWLVDDQPTVDNSVRPVHLSTRSFQSMIWNALCCCQDDSDNVGQFAQAAAIPTAQQDTQPTTTIPPSSRVDGFRVDRDSVEVQGRTIVIPFTAPAARPSLKATAFAVAVLESEGWKPIEVKNVGPDDAGLSATLTLAEPVDTSRLRVVVRGTGEQPVVSRDLAPLLGCYGDPAVGSTGCDAVIMPDPSASGPRTTN